MKRPHEDFDRESNQIDQLLDDFLPNERTSFDFGRGQAVDFDSFALSQPRDTIRLRPYSVTRSTPRIEKDRNSPEFLATCRRLRCRNLAKILSNTQPDNETLFVTDLAIFRQNVIKLIDFLFRGDRKLDNPTEGNTCEVLRSLRDGSANDGWKRFQTRETLAAAVKVLTSLADANEVSARESRQLIKALESAGLSTIDDRFIDALLSGDQFDEDDVHE